jgi:hypothetical protein
MSPGSNCMSCHDGSQATKFTVAGTVYGSATAGATAGVAGATVVITDANFVDTTLTTNSVGNFFTAKTIATPFTVRVGTLMMGSALSQGGCAACHTVPGLNAAPGRVFTSP